MDDTLRALVDTREQMQKARIQFGNRLDSIMRGEDACSEERAETLSRYYNHFLDIERELDRDISSIVANMPIYHCMFGVKGIGPVLAAKLIALIDIERCPTVSSLWRYAGLAVIDGKRERMVKGEKMHYNRRLKVTCYLIAMSFIKSRSPYRRLYDEKRAYYEQNRPDWLKMHRHLAAMRYMVKIFLQHLWITWRTLSDLPVTMPYVHAVNGHNHYVTPAEMGWLALPPSDPKRVSEPGIRHLLSDYSTIPEDYNPVVVAKKTKGGA